jgi:hypothetical protein
MKYVYVLGAECTIEYIFDFDLVCRSMLITVPARSKALTVFPAQTLGSWVPLPLEAWMSVCVNSVFVLSSVQVVVFATG